MQERIDTLTGEITNLEREIAELRALAAQLMGDTDISERLSEEQRAKIIEREMTKRLVETLSAMEYAKTELYAYSTETRKLYEEAVERDREEDNIVNKTLFRAKDRFFQSKNLKNRLKQYQIAAFNYSYFAPSVPQSVIYRACKEQPYHSALTKNVPALFIGNYIKEHETSPLKVFSCR